MSLFGRLSSLGVQETQVMIDVARKKALTLEDTFSNKIRFRVNKVDPFVDYVVYRVGQLNGMSSLCEFYLMSNTLLQGPKVYCPKQTECESLENLDINILFDDFIMPFPFFAIQLPNNYVKNKVAECVQAGTFTLDGKLYPEKHQLDFILIHYHPEFKYFLIGAYLSSHQCLVRFFGRDHPTQTIEECLRDSYPIHKHSMSVSDEEQQIAECAYRIAINACLVLTNSGFKEGTAYSNEKKKQFNLINNLSKSKLPLDKIKVSNARKALNSIPTEYVLDQNIKIYDSERTVRSGESGSPSGVHVRPHWRRGHWRRQAFGTGLTQRKLIAIKPVLVNQSDLTAVNPQGSTTIYK
jgi:hypothetical protein